MVRARTGREDRTKREEPQRVAAKLWPGARVMIDDPQAASKGMQLAAVRAATVSCMEI